MKSVILTGKNITKQFFEASTPILQGIDITLYEGDFTVIMGASGAGKSTLLYALSGMTTIDEGEVYYHQKNIVEYTEKQMASLRASAFGFVFQQTHLVSNLTLFENVAVAGYLDKNRSTAETNKRAEELLQQMKVGHASNRLPAKVSGGEAQRAAIARAIVNHPELLFADEPTGALNRKHSDDVLTILQELHESGQSILMVTHDLRAAARGSRILYLEDGKILAELNLNDKKQMGLHEREAMVNQWLSSLMW